MKIGRHHLTSRQSTTCQQNSISRGSVLGRDDIDFAVPLRTINLMTWTYSSFIDDFTANVVVADV